jgi:hypothetical protein
LNSQFPPSHETATVSVAETAGGAQLLSHSVFGIAVSGVLHLLPPLVPHRERLSIRQERLVAERRNRFLFLPLVAFIPPRLVRLVAVQIINPTEANNNNSARPLSFMSAGNYDKKN